MVTTNTPCRPRRDPFAVLDDADRLHHLHAALAIASFALAAGLGIATFFLINEAALWVGVGRADATIFVSVAWVMIFPVWALVYLVILSCLSRLGIKDLRAVVRFKLSALCLDPAQLRDLQGAIAARRWRHRRVFARALTDLSGEPRR